MDFQTILNQWGMTAGGRDLQSRVNRVAQREIAELDMLFVKLGINAWIDRGRVVASQTGDFIRYPVLTGGKIATVTNVERDLSVALTRLRGESTPVKIRLPEQYIELPFPLETRPLLWTDANPAALGKFELIIGRDQSATTPAPVTLDFKDRSVSHILVSGTTGSGKSNELACMILSLAWSTSPADVRIVVLDPKFSPEIGALGGLPHVDLFQETQDCLDAIASVKAEMNARKRTPRRQRLFLVVEEFAELGIESGGATDLIEPLKSVAGVGRGLGVHVIACTQKATVGVVDTVLRANLPIRIAGQVSTQAESAVAVGVPNAGAELLPGRGSFLYNRNGRVRRIQGHYVPEDEIAGIVAQIAARWHGVTPYEIAYIQSEETAPIDELAGYVDKVQNAIALEDIFDADGAPARGIKTQIVKVLFGADAKPGGQNHYIVNAVLERLRELSFSS
jgi:hypothetical protein